MEQQKIILIMVAVVLLGAAAAFFLFGKDGENRPESIGELFGNTESAIDEATAIPDTNPLREVNANPYEDYKNPFSR